MDAGARRACSRVPGDPRNRLPAASSAAGGPGWRSAAVSPQSRAPSTAVLSLAGGASTAFAGWSAQPTTASPAQLQAAQSYCSANIPDPNTTTQQLVDSRGPYTIIVYAGPAGSTQTYNFCTVGPSFRNASGWTSYPPVTPAAGQLFLWSDHTSTRQRPALRHDDRRRPVPASQGPT